MLPTAAVGALALMLATGPVSFWIVAVGVLGSLVLAWFARPRPKARYETVVTVLLTATVSPFVMAFAAKLGERLGTAVKIERLPWRQGRQRQGELVVAPAPARGRTIILEVDSEVSDEARLALIELDVGRPELWGHRLRWDEGAKAWLPVPPGSDSETSD